MVKKLTSVLNQLFAYAQHQGLIIINPNYKIKITGSAPAGRQTLSRKEAEKLSKALNWAHPAEAILYMCLHTGARKWVKS